MAWAIVGIHNLLQRNSTLRGMQSCREVLGDTIAYARVITDASFT